MSYLDAALDSTGDLAEVSRFVTGIDLVEQRIRVRLQRGSGEWFLDPDGTGLPFIEWRGQKPPDLTAINLRVQQEIASVPGVLRLENFEALHDAAARQVTVSGDVYVGPDESTTVVAVVGAAGARNLSILAIQFASRSISGAIARPTAVGL